MENASQVIVFENLREASPSGEVVRFELPSDSFDNPNAVAAIATMTFDEITKSAAEFGKRFRAATALT